LVVSRVRRRQYAGNLAAILDEAMYDRRTITSSHYPHDPRPDQNQHGGWPAAVEHRYAASDSEDIISSRLNDIASDHYVDRKSEAKGHLDGNPATPLGRTSNEGNLFRVQDNSQMTIYANQCAYIANTSSQSKLALNVAKSSAIPPIHKVF
jgi:hypothetical protein